MIDRLHINHFYTTPSTIRYLMKDPDKCIEQYKDTLNSLRTIASGFIILLELFVMDAINHNCVSLIMSVTLLHTVGETLNNNACEWYYKQVGHEKCTLVDTWWQTGDSLKYVLLCKSLILLIPVLNLTVIEL